LITSLVQKIRVETNNKLTYGQTYTTDGIYHMQLAKYRLKINHAA